MRSGSASFALADEHGMLLVVNDALCRLFGRRRDELLGRSLQDFAHADDALTHPAMVELLRVARVDGVLLGLQQRYRRPDGSSREVWASSTTTTDREGRLGVVTVLHDTTAANPRHRTGEPASRLGRPRPRTGR